MLIEYCDKCGMRVPEKELQDGRAVRMDERLYCEKCCPAPATKAVPKVKHTSEAKIVLATPRSHEQPISEGTLKAHARGARAHEPRGARGPGVRQDGLSKPMLAGILATVAGVMLLALVLMSGGKSEQTHNPRAEAPDLSKGSENPPSASNTASGRRPDPPRTANVIPPAGVTPPAATAGREGQAEKAYAAIQSEAASQDADTRKAKLKEFIDAYSDTIVAARARVELARLDEPLAQPQPTPQPGPAPNPDAAPPAVVTSQANGTTYVLQQGLEGYQGCEDTFLFYFHPKVVKHGLPELNFGRGMVPLIRFAIFKSEGGPVPDGAKILSAKLSMERFVADIIEIQAYSILKDCRLDAATWDDAAPGLAWDVAGVAAKGKDCSAEPETTLSIGRGTTSFELDLTESVRKSAAGGKNRGWVLHGGQTASSYCRIYSSQFDESAKRPKLTIVVAGNAQPAVAAGAPTDGLVIYLPFDEKEGTVAKDASGANNNGQVSGGVNWTEGKVGGALRLDGATGRVTLARLAVNKNTGARNTVAMWVHAEFSDSMAFCWSGLGDLLFARGGFGFNTYASDQLGVSTDEFKANAWNHVVAVFPNDIPTEQNATLYVNGKRMSITRRLPGLPGGAVGATEDATIGACHGKQEYFLRGAIDEFRIYNREVSEAEAAALYAAGGAPAVPVAPANVAPSGPAQGDGLILHLPFRKGGAEFTQDISGKGCTVQLMNGAVPITANRGVSLNFPSGNAYAEVQGLARDANADARHTVTFWMYPRSNVSGMPFAWKDQSYCLYLTAHGFGINTGEFGNILGVDGTRIKAKEWVHVAAVFPNGVPNLDNIALYLDGKRVAEKLAIAPMPAQARTATQGIYLGGIPTGSYYFNGILQDVRVYNRQLAEEEVKAVFENKPLPPRSAPAAVASQDLVMHLPFDEKSGDVAKDTTGNGHDAALKNGPQFGAGRIGGALKFDGTDDCAEIPDFDYGPDFTLAFWFNIDPGPRARYQYLFGHGVYDKTNCCLVYVDLNEKKIRTYLRDGNDGHIVREYDIPYEGVGNWSHYAVQVTRADGLKIFLDGKLLKTGRHGRKGVNPQTSLTLGIRWDLDRERIFRGALDDLRLYNRALSAEEIAVLARGDAAAAATATADGAPLLSAEDKALDERLKRWRVLWSAGETKSLRDDLEALRKEGGAHAEQAAAGEAALAAREAAWKQAAALQGKSVRLALAQGETQTGKIERLDGDRFEFNLGGLVTRYHLGDLAWETLRAWADASLAGDAEKTRKLAAAALLVPGVDAEKEAAADANLSAAWAPLFASAGRVDSSLKNDAVWAEILGLVKAQKWLEVNSRAQGLLDAPPGGRLSAELKEKVEKLLADTKASIQVDLAKPENLPLQVRAKALGDGKIELRYDLSNPRQILDFEGLDTHFVRVEGGALNLGSMQIRHKLDFQGDLSISYEAASTATKPRRLLLQFYGMRGEIGYEGKDESTFWYGSSTNVKTVKSNPLVAKQWNRIEIQYTAATKQTRVAVNGAELLTAATPQAADTGVVTLGSYTPFLIRNLVLTGKPAPNAAEDILRVQAFSEALQKKLAQGETVKIFTAEDEKMWRSANPTGWQFDKGVARGEGTLALPGLALRDFEAELDLHLAGADRVRLVLRQGAKDRHSLHISSRDVIGHVHDRLNNYAARTIGNTVQADFNDWHHFSIQSKGGNLKVILDRKDVVIDEQQANTESMGFVLWTEAGKAVVRNVTVKALR